MIFGLSYSFFFLACSLILWINFFEHKVLKPFFGVITLIALFSYAFHLFGDGSGINDKLGELSLNLFLLAVISLISQYTRKFWLLKLGWVALIGFVFIKMLDTSRNNEHLLIQNDLDPNAEFLVDLQIKGEIPNDLQDIIKQYNLRTEIAFHMTSEDETDLDEYIILDVPNSNWDMLQRIYNKISKLKSLDWIEPNELIKQYPLLPGQNNSLRSKSIDVNDPDVNKQWSYTKTGMNELFTFLNKEKVQFQKRAKLYILDTGVDALHEDLSEAYLSSDIGSNTDVRGHGTHCAGIGGAVSNNKIGIASVSPNSNYYSISSIKVINDMGYGFQRNIINGILKAVDEGADVISLSLGAVSNQRRQTAYNEAVAYANLKNTIIVVAAGNSGENAKGYSPANSKGVIVVSAIDENLNKANFSNSVQDLKYGIAAPGVNIYSTMPKNNYASLSGTSMATPHVAGLVTLMKSFEPSLNTAEVYQILDNTGIPTTSRQLTGKLIQSDKAIKQLLK